MVPLLKVEFICMSTLAASIPNGSWGFGDAVTGFGDGDRLVVVNCPCREPLLFAACGAACLLNCPVAIVLLLSFVFQFRLFCCESMFEFSDTISDFSLLALVF